MKDERSLLRPFLNEGILKLIAVITMFIDHAAAVFIENAVLHQLEPELSIQILSTEAGIRWLYLDMILRTIGRVAFPIFCFLLVEGFLHTRDVKKYFLRLAAFAFISEVPFDLAIFETWFYPQYQNVFFTLAIGLAVLAGLRRLKGRPILQFLVYAAGAGLSLLFKTDYDIIGVTLITAFYLLNGNILFYPVSFAITFLESGVNFGAAALALIPISLCNGERGRQFPKYFFYGFYPAHLLLLFALRRLLFL